jgi:hypothetical protein
MGKYSKLFKILFNKYANTLRNHTVEDDFLRKDEKSKLLNLGEVIKFAKDHNIMSDLLTKDELQSIIRLINLKDNRKGDSSTLSLE